MRKVDCHAPLNPQDSEKQTLGCRSTNPVNCRKNSLSDICAFVRSDELCQSPPRSWAKQYRRLLSELESPDK
jgi:hypothetical protein